MSVKCFPDVWWIVHRGGRCKHPTAAVDRPFTYPRMVPGKYPEMSATNWLALEV